MWEKEKGWGEPDAEALEKICGRAVMRSILAYFAGKGIKANEWTDAAAARSESGLNYSDMLWLFRELYDANFGWFAVGRRGRKTRFQWRLAPSDILKMLEVPEPAPKAPEEPKKSAAMALVEHLFRLRTDQTVSLTLPADLTRAEATRLATFVTSLPFEP